MNYAQIWSLLGTQMFVLFMLIHNQNSLCLVGCKVKGIKLPPLNIVMVYWLNMFNIQWLVWWFFHVTDVNGPKQHIDLRRRTMWRHSSSQSSSPGKNWVTDSRLLVNAESSRHVPNTKSQRWKDDKVISSLLMTMTKKTQNLQICYINVSKKVEGCASNCV